MSDKKELSQEQSVQLTPEQLAMKDQQFREQMRERTDPEAKQWVELDKAAEKQETRIGEYDREINRRKGLGSDIYEIEQQLSIAQDDRDAHLSTGRPGIFEREARSAWDNQLKEFNSEVGSYQSQLMEMARQSTPEKIEGLQERLEVKQQALEQTIEQRQGIAKLPSEEVQVSMQERIQQSSQSWSPSQDEAQRQSGNGQALVQGQEQEAQSQRQPDGSEAGRRLNPSYAKAAETQADRDFVKQLEADQQGAFQKYGHVPNDKEMQAFIKEREASQPQQQPQVQQPAQQNDGFQSQIEKRRSSQSM